MPHSTKILRIVGTRRDTSSPSGPVDVCKKSKGRFFHEKEVLTNVFASLELRVLLARKDAECVSTEVVTLEESI